MSFVVHAREARGSARLGGKATALAALDGLEFPIPLWFVVTLDAFYQSLSKQQRRQLENPESPEDIARVIEHLESEVKAGKFRTDLFSHLSAITLRLPPLRDRPHDIRLLRPLCFLWSARHPIQFRPGYRAALDRCLTTLLRTLTRRGCGTYQNRNAVADRKAAAKQPAFRAVNKIDRSKSGF
jgi:hypothetical protein